MRLALASATPLIFALNLHAQAVSAQIPIQQVSGLPVVQVSVNGTGPYPFVLDTGANVTVITKQLLRRLHMLPAGSVTIAAALGDSHQERIEAAALDLGGLSVEAIEINSMEDSQLGMLKGNVQRILGENFLKHFDLLIDNDHHQLTLDSTANLSTLSAGEHLPVTRVGNYHSAPTGDRILIPLRLTLLTRPLLFLLDSGTNAAMLFPVKEETAGLAWGSSHGKIESLSVLQTCHVKRTDVRMGSQRFPGVALAACEDRTRDKSDSDGLLPTALFHKVFISHRWGYVIANPHLAK